MKISDNNKVLLVITFIFYFLIDWGLFRVFDFNAYILLCIKIFFVLLAFSPMGSFIMRLVYDYQLVLTKRDKERLIPLFNDVLASAGLEVKDLNKGIKLCIDNTNQVNAYALGSNTVVITRGAILQLDDEQIKGILAHEIGHLIHGDTFINIFFMIGNLFFLFFILIFKFIIWFFNLVAYTINDERVKPKIINILFGSIATCCLLIIHSLIMVTQRNCEYDADDFALKIGYGKELVSGLYYLSHMQIGQKLSILERIKSSHPNIYRRIAYLEEKL